MNDSIPKASILVVDDDPALLRLLGDTLEAIGYQVTQVDSGAKALDILQETVFDLMITDIKMPDIDGLQLFRKVRRQFSQMPVLFITGVASQEIMASAEADGFLSKPFRISRIEELIQQTLRHKAEGNPERPRRVLIVDQDKHLCKYLSEALTLADFLPFTASNRREAIQQLSDGQFDAIIAEDSTADSGNRFTPSEIGQDYPDLPLIITTDRTHVKAKPRNGEAGSLLGFLKKPFKASEILALLSRVDPADLEK